MARIFTALVVSVAVAMCVPLGAAQKATAAKTAASTKAAPAKAAPAKTASAKTPVKAKAKAKTTSKAKKTVAARPAQQQHPTTERYTEIQQALVDRGYLAEATGNWGTDSVAALKKFQQEQGLPVDGKLGALSLTALGLGPRRGAGLETITAGLPLGSLPTPLD